jgi:uncharacterized protein (DUF1800 family)
MKIARKLSVVLTLVAAFGTAYGQDDPDPNSPSPVLLSGTVGDRILATTTRTVRGRTLKASTDVFWPGQRSFITIYVRNIEPMPDELRGSLRVYLTQKSGRTFELAAGELTPSTKEIYSLRVRLYDRDGYRGQPVADGDSLIYATWRGMVSNVLRIGLGSADNSIEIPKWLTKSSQMPVDEYVGYRWSGDRIRFQEQAAFGPSGALDLRLRRIGLRTWLAEQFEMPYPTIAMPDPPQMPLNVPANCMLTTDHVCYRQRYTMMPLQQWFFREAFYGDAQLRHRVAWALSQIWVTSGVVIQQSSHEIAFHKILMQNAFDNYRKMLLEGTLSPTMGFYLDMVRSTRANPNENYPHEILQLFSIGLYRLNQDGTPVLDGQGNPIPTYDQETINNLSKVFTGWTYCNTCPNGAPGILNYKDPMALVPANHDLTAKSLLDYPNAVGRDIPACTSCATPAEISTYANNSLQQAIDNIFNHPNVGPFIGKLLIQHLVTSDPSPAYVSRVAGVFNNNGAGVRGDMKAVVRAILLDPEARGDVKTAPRYGKLREPVQYLTNLGRIFPARDFNGISLSDGALHAQSSMLGQNPFYSPTVFNYYSPDFVIPNSTILAPEFEILNTTTAINRTNILYTLVFEGITPNATDSLRGTSLDFSEVLPAAQADPSGNQLLDVLNNKMLHGTLSPEHRAAILTAIAAVPASDSLKRVRTAVYLIAASSQYQIQR